MLGVLRHRVAVIVIVILGISLIGSKTEKNPPDVAAAWTVCEQFVTERLKAPSTAKFQWISRDELGNRRFHVNAYVDSQNSFGAMLRTHFNCTVKHIEGDRWRLEDLVTRQP